MKKNRFLILAFGVLVVVLVIVGVVVSNSNKSTSGGASSSSSSAMTKAVATNAVAIQGYMFSPMAITVKTGTTVTWTNKDDVHHTVTSDSGSLLASGELGQNQSYSHKFTTAGTYSYYCMDHPYMKATVTVTN